MVFYAHVIAVAHKGPANSYIERHIHVHTAKMSMEHVHCGFLTGYYNSLVYEYTRLLACIGCGLAVREAERQASWCRAEAQRRERERESVSHCMHVAQPLCLPNMLKAMKQCYNDYMQVQYKTD